MTTIINEDFEGTGLPSGWVVSKGTPDFDYTAAPLSGTESLYIDNDAGGMQVKIPLGAAQSEVQLKFALNIQSYPATANEDIIAFRNSSDQRVASLLVSSGVARFRGYNGTSVYTGPSDLVGGTTYYVWLDFVTGTGADSSIELYYNTVDSKPASPAASHSTGNATDDVDHILLGPLSYRGMGDMLFDDITVDVPDVVPTIDDIDTDETTEDGQVGATVTYTGFGSDITSLTYTDGTRTTANLLTSASGGSGLYDLPDITNLPSDTVGLPFSSANHSLEATVSDGTDTTVVPVTHVPATGFMVVDLVNADVGDFTVFPDGKTVPDFSQVLVETTHNTEVLSSGVVLTDAPDGTVINGLFWDSSTGLWELFDFTVEGISSQDAPTPPPIPAYLTNYTRYGFMNMF